MATKIGINGYGRIGRNILRSIYEYNRRDEFQVVAVNNLSSIEVSALLTRRDTTHGVFHADVTIEGDNLVVNGDPIRVCAARSPEELPWRELGVDVVMECTGKFTSREQCEGHLRAGAKKVVISAPGEGVDATVVYGVNHDCLKASDTIISNASCTTNCLAPVAKLLHNAIGIESGLMTTVHAYTNDQVLIDAGHKDPRRARSATHSIIPTKTGAALAVGKVIPELKGKLDGFAVRVPTINVSLVDLTFIAMRDTNVEEINQLMLDASRGDMHGIIEYNDEPLVSIDFNHNPASAIFDSTQTKVQGRLVKAMSWYDNEWGFSNRMLDTTAALLAAQ